MTEGGIRLATWDYYDKEGNKIFLADCKDDEEVVESPILNRINKDGKIILYKKFHVDKNALAGIIVHSYSQLEFDSIKNLLHTILNTYARRVVENITLTSAYPFNV